jgi:hypothetical protein
MIFKPYFYVVALNRIKMMVMVIIIIIIIIYNGASDLQDATVSVY